MRTSRCGLHMTVKCPVDITISARMGKRKQPGLYGEKTMIQTTTQIFSFLMPQEHKACETFLDSLADRDEWIITEDSSFKHCKRISTRYVCVPMSIERSKDGRE